MRRISKILPGSIPAILIVSLLAVMARTPVPARADAASGPSLVISQFKITSSNGQFVTLYNTTAATLDMSKYQLEYFNNYDLSKATSSKLIALSGTIPPHGYFMVNDSTLLLCYRLTVDSLSLDLSSTAGLVEVLAFSQNGPGNSALPTLQDYVGWSKTPVSGVQSLPAATSAFLQRQPLDSGVNPIVNIPGTGSWQSVQPDTTNPCALVSSAAGTAVNDSSGQLLAATEPPAIIVSLTSNGTNNPVTPKLPTADIGLMAPQVTELLPNPVGTGNDAIDEFVEVYNPNMVAFDLTSFSLQSGTTTLHHYTFPAGTSLQANSFTAFYAANTGLSMSNNGGQVKLLDPSANSVSATDVYGRAPDGQAWARANGAWYWTSQPTPNTANLIKQSPTKKATKKSSAKTIKHSSTADTTPNDAKTAASPGTASATTPIHPWVLALVAVAALLYGTYEYRADLAHRLRQFRRYLAHRFSHRA